MIYHKPIWAFGLLGIILVVGGMFAKLLTITNTITISLGLSTGFIILGVVSLMMGMFASIVFKRQSFAEKDLRHYVNELNKQSNRNFDDRDR